MPLHDCMDVRIDVDGQPLVEYPDPDDTSNSHHEFSRYIEVKSGQTFSVRVKILPGFQIQSAPYLYVSFQIDQETTFHYRYWSIKDEATLVRGRLQKQLTAAHAGVPYKQPVTGVWHMHGLQFGALGISETASFPPKLSTSDLEKLGSIRVSIFRAKKRKLDVPYVWDCEEPESLDELPEKALKGRALKNNVKFVAKTTTVPYPPEYYDYIPINGVHGQIFNFVFRYRNREILQSLGCIPRSPSSPGPDAALMLERTEDMLRISKQQAWDLNLRLLLLQLAQGDTRESLVDLTSDNRGLLTDRELSIKLEDEKLPASDTSNVNLTANIKREIEEQAPQSLGKRLRSATIGAEEDDDDDDLVEVAPPPKKPVICVDLTDD